MNYSFLTLKERDIETGLDYFGARYYSSTQGRFTSADEPFAGQDEEDPQTWNLYSYTSNNPLSRHDPDGRRWFYTKDDKGNITDLQWVNPNDDGSYTSPGEGWIAFIPTKKNPWLLVPRADGLGSYKLGENADGSPANGGTLWTGRVADASWDIIGFYLTSKAFTAVTNAAWGAWVAHRASHSTW